MFAAFRTHLTLRRLRRASAARPAFRRALALRLESERALLAPPRWSWLPSPRMAAVPLAVVLMLAVSGTSAYAYGSDAVTEGHALYPVKRGIEEVEATVAPTAALKARIRIKQAERRVREAERLFARTADAVPALEAADAASAKALDAAAQARPAARARILEQLRARDAAMAERLEQAARTHPLAAAEVVERQIRRNIARMEAQLAGITDPEVRAALERRLEKQRELLGRVGAFRMERREPERLPERDDDDEREPLRDMREPDRR